MPIIFVIGWDCPPKYSISKILFYLGFPKSYFFKLHSKEQAICMFNLLFLQTSSFISFNNVTIVFFNNENKMFKKLPLITILLISLSLLACAEEKEGPAEKTGKKINSTNKEVKKDSKDLGKKISEKMDNVKEKTSETLDSFKEKTGETVGSLKEKTGETVDSLKEKTGEVVDTLKEKTEDVKEATKETIGNLKEKTKDTAEKVKEKAEELIEDK